MKDRPPFDSVRASFWLVAIVIMAQVFIAVVGVGTCIVYSRAIVAGIFECDKGGRLLELLTNALTAALAFAAGFLKAKSDG